MAKALVWKGDPKHCNYCRESVFPHSHAADTEVAKATRKPKDIAKDKKPRKQTPTNKVVSFGRRGRPMKPENLDLLTVCHGHAV